MILPIILLQAIGLLFATRAAQSQSSWQFPLFRPSSSSSDLEREGSSSYVRQLEPARSPALIGRHLAQLWSRNNGRLPEQMRSEQAYYLLRDTDQFQCLDPSRTLYQDFKKQYNRTYRDAQEELERSQWFRATLKRAIMFNRIVQDQVLNRTDKAIRNFHFIEPKYGEENLALWYADITDCELGLIKHNIFQIIHFVDTNQLQLALDIVHKHSDYLGTLASDDGLEQLAEILLVRLFDRFRGDTKMNQLFQWPMYLKKLAAFAYSQQQAQQADFKTKLELVAFAYPAYFKDVKYNYQAINRTNDNVRANAEHAAYNARYGRKYDGNLAERNRRLAIFRQRWTLVNQLNGEPPEGANSTRHLLPDWLRMQFIQDGPSSGSEPELDAAGSPFARLIEPAGSAQDAGGDSSETQRPFRLTQFSDLTDLEFQAFLSNDFSLLAGNKDSAEFLDKNFPVRPLDERLRWEVAHELELRRGASLTRTNIELLGRSGQFLAALGTGPNEQQQQQQAGGSPSLKLAKQVVDELISDVGLPLGPVTQERISEQEQMRAFTQVASHWQKPYLLGDSASVVDERARRFEQFKENYGRFKAWFTKDGWRLGDEQSINMLRLADLSWLEIKLGLFKVCCLSEDNLLALSPTNPTIQYLGSNFKILCGQVTPGSQLSADQDAAARRAQQQQHASVAARTQERQRQQPGAGADQAELTARELYYYYSVHFNKHHASRQEAERHFNIFRRNIEALRRHSCKRSLTLYESFRLNQTDFLNTIDVLDPRRSHTDDLNLDRFEYFSLPVKFKATREFVSQAPARLAHSDVEIDASRSGGFSYRRRGGDLFAALLERGSASQRQQQQQSNVEYQVVSSSHARLQDSWQSPSESAHKYRENNVAAIYQLVMSRYKFCLKQTKGIDLTDNQELKLSCKTDGALADQAVQLGPTHEFLQQQQQQERDRCALYFQGLEPWSEDLIPQANIVANSIINARCQRT